LENVRGFRGLKGIASKRYNFCNGCAEGILANEVIGEQVVGHVVMFASFGDVRVKAFCTVCRHFI